MEEEEAADTSGMGRGRRVKKAKRMFGEEGDDDEERPEVNTGISRGAPRGG